MATKIGVGLAVDGEAKFRESIKEVTRQLKLLDSEAKVIKETYAGNTNTLEALTAKQGILAKQLDQTEKKVQLNRDQMEQWQKVQQNAAKKSEELKEALANAESKMEDMKTSSTGAKDELEKQQKVIDDLSRELENAEQTYDKAGEKVDRYQTNLNTAESQLIKLNREIKDNEKYMEEAEKSMDGTASSIDEYGNKIEDAADKTSVFGDVLKANLVSETIIKGIEAIAHGIGKISSAAISTGSTFEASMSQVAATMGMTAEEIEAGSKNFEILKNAATESGKSTKYSASEAADALNYLALAGYDAQKSAETLPKVLDLAAAGGIDLAYASDLVTDSMSALGLETSDLDNYIDEMARTAQKSNTSIAQLGEATLVCAGTATMADQQLETMNAQLGVLANRGIKGAEGGTALRNVILSLITPTDKAAVAINDMGLKVSDSKGNIRDMNDIMSDLNNKLSEMSATDKANTLNTIFNKNDIAAVNALLKGTGKEFNDLKSELQNCSGAAANMAETMNANLTGKVTILKSALEALGNSAYEKIEGTLKDSVDAATGSIGRLQESMDEGELGRAMDDFAQSLGDAAEGAIDFAEDALPALIDGLSWVLDNSDLVISGITGIVAAEIYHGTIAPLIQSTTAAWQAYKAANEGATIAQWAMNSAMLANPAGLIATALAGLITMLGTYALLSGDATSATQEMLDKNSENIDKLNEGIQKRKESSAANATEITVIGNLKKEITELNAKEHLSNDEKMRMQALVGQINQAMPELSLTIDEQTGKLAENTEGWEQNATALLESLEMQYKQKDLEEVYEAQYEARKQLVEIEEQMRQQEEETAAAREKYSEVMKEMQALYGDQTELYGTVGMAEMQAIADSEAAQKALQEQYQETQTIIGDLEIECQELAEGITEIEKAASESTETLVDYKDKTYDISEATAATKEKIELLQQAYADAKVEAVDSISSQVGLFDELSVKSDLTTKQMADNIKSQTDTFNVYASDLKTAADLAAEGILDEGLLGAIQELGISGAGYLHELVTAAETDKETFNELMSSWAEMTEAKEILSSTMADVQTNYSEQMDGFLGIVEEKNESINQSVYDAAEVAGKTVTEKGEEIAETAEKTMESVDSTIKKEGETVQKTTVKVVSDTTTAIKTELNIGEDGYSLKYKDIGKAMTDGMVAGINEGKSDVINAAVDAALSAYRAAKEALEINSPSKKFGELGYWSAEGFSESMLERMAQVKTTLQDAMLSVTDINGQTGDINTESVIAGGTVIESMQLVFQPQTMTDEEMDKAFEYVNRRFGSAARG